MTNLGLGCWILYLMSIMDVICYTPASFKFGVWTPWRWHKCAKTCSSSERPYF